MALRIAAGVTVQVVLALAIGLFALFLSFPVQHAEATAVTWDGGGDGSSWSDPANWSGDTLPTSTDTITIDGNVVDLTVALDVDFHLDTWRSILITCDVTLNIPFGVTLSNY